MIIKLKSLLKENIKSSKDEYIIQQNWEGYDAWTDKNKSDNIKLAMEKYHEWKKALGFYNEDKTIIRVIKRTTIIKEEIINL